MAVKAVKLGDVVGTEVPLVSLLMDTNRWVGCIALMRFFHLTEPQPRKFLRYRTHSGFDDTLPQIEYFTGVAYRFKYELRGQERTRGVFY